MERDYKKGFTLAEMLVVFLLISIMLAIFAPSMTKRAKRSIDPSCPNGYKTVIAEYTVPGTYTFTAPENIIAGENNATVILVSGGGKGDDYNELTGIGKGGASGNYYTFPTTLVANSSYGVIVGAGGIASEDNGFPSVFGDGVSQNGGVNGGNATSEGGVNANFGDKIKGGMPGAVCDETQSCNPHGKPGSNYEKNELSNTGFIAGTGGGAGGYDMVTDTKGVGGKGGDGYVRITYKIHCN